MGRTSCWNDFFKYALKLSELIVKEKNAAIECADSLELHKGDPLIRFAKITRAFMTVKADLQICKRLYKIEREKYYEKKRGNTGGNDTSRKDSSI